MSEWIKCDDKMPEPGVNVLAYFTNEYHKQRIIKAFYAPKFSIVSFHDEDFSDYDEEGNCYLSEGWYESNEYEDNHWFVDAKVTHWRLMPEYPEDS